MSLHIHHLLRNSGRLLNNGRSMSSGILNNIENVNTTTSNTKQKQPQQNIHVTVQHEYPQAAPLPLPTNIDPTETTRFSPQRSRDISANAILSHQSLSLSHPIDVKLDNSSNDPHVASYDCTGAVSLNSAMQSNVPSPFGGMQGFTHLNMPGGQWEQGNKFMAHDLQSSHYTNLRREVRMDWSSSYDVDYNPAFNKGTIGILTKYNNSLLTSAAFPSITIARKYGTISTIITIRNCSSKSQINTSSKSTAAVSNSGTDNDKVTENPSSSTGPEKLSKKDMLKRAVKEYGSTVIIFHVSISLVSLGICYGAVSSGLDVMKLLEYLNLGNSALSSKVASGAGTFVIAYAIHKIFAPVRISITLGSAPFIVRFLRKKGILKPPKPQN